MFLFFLERKIDNGQSETVDDVKYVKVTHMANQEEAERKSTLDAFWRWLLHFQRRNNRETNGKQQISSHRFVKEVH